jgi:hypothetical protein
MALETLKEVKSIDGFEVKRVVWKQPSENFIEVNDDHNAVTFKLQNGPIKEAGVNGCQVDTVIAAARTILDGLNKKLPSRETALAITKLDEAIHWLKARRQDREVRGVEGTQNA